MDKVDDARKYLAIFRWTVLVLGILATLAGWMISGQMTPMIMLPTTLGVIGFVVIYVLWAVAHLHMETSKRQDKIEKRLPRRVVWEREMSKMMRN